MTTAAILGIIEESKKAVKFAEPIVEKIIEIAEDAERLFTSAEKSEALENIIQLEKTSKSTLLEIIEDIYEGNDTLAVVLSNSLYNSEELVCKLQSKGYTILGFDSQSVVVELC